MRLVLIIAAALWATLAAAQDTQTRQPEGIQTPDHAAGAPYRTGDISKVRGEGSPSSEVPLRDYMSSRIDQLRAEVLDRFAIMEKQSRDIIDERDKQYAQRFAAQQEALTAALQAAKEAVANALSAAKEAVTKAEDSSNKRFESVNEFRKTLADQATMFVSKDTFDARVTALEEKAESSRARIDEMQNKDAGASGLWLVIAGVVGVVCLIAAFGINLFGKIKPERPPS